MAVMNGSRSRVTGVLVRVSEPVFFFLTLLVVYGTVATRYRALTQPKWFPWIRVGEKGADRKPLLSSHI